MTKTQKNKLKKRLREAMLLRDGHRCTAMGMGDCGGPLHTSHIYSQGKYRKMAFELDNVKTLCMRHHLYWWHKNPIEATEWIKTTLSQSRLDRLKELAQINTAPIDYEEIKESLEAFISAHS